MFLCSQYRHYAVLGTFKCGWRHWTQSAPVLGAGGDCILMGLQASPVTTTLPSTIFSIAGGRPCYSHNPRNTRRLGECPRYSHRSCYIELVCYPVVERAHLKRYRLLCKLRRRLSRFLFQEKVRQCIWH